MGTPQTAVDAMNNATDAVNGFVNASRNEVNNMQSQTDNALLNLANSHAQTIISYYDSAVFDKSVNSLNPVLDSISSTKTQWQLVPTIGLGARCYPVENRLTKVHARRCRAISPGHIDTPPFSLDNSTSRIQFVLANEQANSQQINQRLQETGQVARSHGGWDTATRVLDIPTIKIPGVHRYSRLFVRFVNYSMLTGTQPQNILNFGGNSPFAIEQVINYPLIPRG